jgi:hypothetical protein
MKVYSDFKRCIFRYPQIATIQRRELARHVTSSQSRPAIQSVVQPAIASCWLTKSFLRLAALPPCKLAHRQKVKRSEGTSSKPNTSVAAGKEPCHFYLFIYLFVMNY